MSTSDSSPRFPRRSFLKTVASTTAVGPLFLASQSTSAASDTGKEHALVLDRFDRPDSWYHGDNWESLNPGFWKIEGKRLRRRIRNYGDRARRTGFPYHYETHGQNGGVMPVDYDPSLPHGTIYRRDWNLKSSFTITMDLKVRSFPEIQRPTDSPDWKMYQEGYSMAGIAFGAQNLFDSYATGDLAWTASWLDDGHLEIREGQSKGKQRQSHRSNDALKLNPDASAVLTLKVVAQGPDSSSCLFSMRAGGEEISVELSDIEPSRLEGFVGIVGRGLLDFEVNHFSLIPGENVPLEIVLNECLNCYPLGATLKETSAGWGVRFVALFRSDGNDAEIRISDSPNPVGGWASVPAAGNAHIVTNAYRRCTSVIDTILPGNPADKTFYYTVWKDGKEVTGDTRIGTAACGAGTGFVGDVPSLGSYVGRLPQLKAPYRLCGLSCHAIHGGRAALPDSQRGGGFYYRDQPTFKAYGSLEEYDFQVMLWEDDVWYLELLLYPPSTDDAYKVIANTICGPTSRWQMMRHWNVINPGDHDYGMDDVKGPEQLAIRWRDGLGQDRDYLRRNFQIVQHLISGDENVSPTANPKKWRRWKMPNRDFSLLILDSRLWRSSQDTKMWDDEGWGHINTLYDREDPTRSLLGEEQFGWLQEMIRTDSSKMICLTGLNGLHTIWAGRNYGAPPYPQFEQRDRVAADYAGWVKAGVDRVIELLGSRDGLVSVYGDVHNGCIMKNLDHRLYECSFGPIGRSGGRKVIDGFGPKMEDYDGRPLEVYALYHRQHGNPDLEPRTGPYYWNFLEMSFDTSQEDSSFQLNIRNMVDAPIQQPRGGGAVLEASSNTGRIPTSKLPSFTTLANADIQLADLDGRPIRGARSNHDGVVSVEGLVGISANTKVLLIARAGDQAEAKVMATLAL
jgi:hypothetical protein